MANPLRPSPLSFDSGRQSPFKRQNSASPATVLATTPTQSPTKQSASLSPVKTGSLSPEKTSPFVRRLSQISQTSERPASPFARPSSSLSIPPSPSRQTSNASKSDEVAPPSPRRTASPEDDEAALTPSKLTPRRAPSPSPFDGAPPSPSPAPASPSVKLPSQANLRPAAQRTVTSSTTSTIKPPNFGAPLKPTAAPTKPTKFPTGGNNTAYKNVPHTLLHSMRESFEVLDPNSTNAITSASVTSMLDQMGMSSNPADVRDFFPPNAPSSLNLARYLDMLSAPLADLSPPEELMAAFSAFDVDDSGQIDVMALRKALLDTAPEPGEDGARLSEREVDQVVGEFVGRRAFGAKGMNVAKGKGEVFRYREFMAAVSGGGGTDGSMVGEGVMVT